MEKGLDFNSFKNTDNPKKAIIALHGWSGNKNSFMPFAKNSKLSNVEWFLPEAPYIIDKDSKKNHGRIRKMMGAGRLGSR